MPLYLPASETSTAADPYTLGLRDASRGLEAEYFRPSGAEALSGLLRALNNTVAVAARNAAGTQDIDCVSTDASNSVVIGEDSHAANCIVKIATGGVQSLNINNVQQWTWSTSGGESLFNVGSSVSGAGFLTAAVSSYLYFRSSHSSGQLYFDSEDVNFRSNTAATTRLRIVVAAGVGGASFFGAGSFGSGLNVIFVANATTNPTTDPTGGGILYVTGGALTYRGSGGTVTTIAPA